jgi:hypothetical protein
MPREEQTKLILSNGSSSVETDLYGGAITDFHLHETSINPLSFRFSKDQMPENNKKGAPFQGHFLCLGRWGAPSDAEIKQGLPYHGQIAGIPWKAGPSDSLKLNIEAFGPLEGLCINRTMQLDDQYAIYAVKEDITNERPMGRLFNIVQHPTIAAPFLDKHTIVNCNASTGFNDVFNADPKQARSEWPLGICEDGTTVYLNHPEKPYTSLFSFVIKKEADIGWITAYSPTHNLLLGYIWKRKEYPWINLWQHWEDDTIRYRGLEFGSTGVHKSFKRIAEENTWKIFGENSCSYIDAGETISRKYLSFQIKVLPGFSGVADIRIENGGLRIMNYANQATDLFTPLITLYGF